MPPIWTLLAQALTFKVLFCLASDVNPYGLEKPLGWATLSEQHLGPLALCFRRAAVEGLMEQGGKQRGDGQQARAYLTVGWRRRASRTDPAAARRWPV